MHYPLAMPETDADRFRKEANECREFAASAVNPLDKETWLRLAVDWQKLADQAEKRIRYKSPLAHECGTYVRLLTSGSARSSIDQR
jgi:hypothetical protein